MARQSSAAQHLYRIIVIFAVFVVAPVNIAGWWAYRSVVSSLEAEFDKRLHAIAAGTADFAGAWLPVNDFDEDALELLTSELQSDVSSFGLRSEFILDENLKRVVSAGSIRDDTGARMMALKDDAAIRRALAGEYTHTLRETRVGVSPIRAYVPVWTGLETGRIASGVVGVEAVAGFYTTTDRIRRGLVIFGIISIVLALLAILVAGRLVHRTVDFENAMERTSRAMSLGRMTSTVAHEIRNPLGIISTNAEVLQRSTDAHTREIGADILIETQRLDRMVRRFLNLSETGESRRVVALAEIVNYAVDAVRKAADATGDAPRPIPLTLDLNIDGVLVECDPDKLHSVFVNVLDNAVDAVEDGGEIRLEGQIDNDRVRITLSDTGPGMDTDTLQHAKEPFYTRKPAGTGLGLAIADRIIRDHGGELNIESAPGKGTRICIILPRMPGDSAAILKN